MEEPSALAVGVMRMFEQAKIEGAQKKTPMQDRSIVPNEYEG
jgi:hypothetical protein